MIAEEALAELSPYNPHNNISLAPKVKEVHLDNMFLCDNQSQYVEFWQRAAILKLNLRSARGDDEYIDMQLLDDIYHKWNQLAIRFHAVCGRFTHSSFLAVISDTNR